MPDNAIARRMITVPVVVALFVALSVSSPLTVTVGATVDLTRRATGRRQAVVLRSLAFLWVYLLGEVWALLALALTAPLPGAMKREATYRLQERWAAWNLSALVRLFSLRIEVAGAGAAMPGPVLVLSRHASLVDTLLPAGFLARPNGMRLRYVLKKELLVDPALDIAGNRLPNVFVDRASRESSERAAIRGLAAGMGRDDGILIYPEGTRFSTDKLRRIHSRAGGDNPNAARLRRVLPPRPGGTLALLEASDADVIVFAHRGLEGLATVGDIWRGSLVGSSIDIAMWRVPRDRVPLDRSERVQWLSDLWAEVDEWVVSGASGGGA